MVRGLLSSADKNLLLMLFTPASAGKLRKIDAFCSANSVGKEEEVIVKVEIMQK